MATTGSPWSDRQHLALLDSFYPSARSFTEAQEQILRLKLELVDKEKELELYLHVAAEVQEAETSSVALAAEVRELRERLRTATALPAPGYYPLALPPAPTPPARQTPLQGTLAEINYAFDLLDEPLHLPGRLELNRRRSLSSIWMATKSQKVADNSLP